jgi:hypothetical protein
MLRNQTLPVLKKLYEKKKRKCVATYCKQVTTYVVEPETSPIRIRHFFISDPVSGASINTGSI